MSVEYKDSRVMSSGNKLLLGQAYGRNSGTKINKELMDEVLKIKYMKELGLSESDAETKVKSSNISFLRESQAIGAKGIGGLISETI